MQILSYVLLSCAVNLTSGVLVFLGKTYTMLGIDDSGVNLGVIPCAISWIYDLINEKVENSHSKFSVRVSAIEVTGKRGIVRDLLAEFSAGTVLFCV